VGQGSGVAMSYGVGRRRGLDPELLWLWRRLAATAPIQPLAWEPPYAAGAAQEMAKRKKKRKKRRKNSLAQRRNSINLITIIFLAVPMACGGF